MELCSNAGSGNGDDFVRVSLGVDGAVPGLCVAQVFFSALANDPRAQHLRGRVYLQLAEAARDLVVGTWLLVERISQTDGSGLICEHPLSGETVKIRQSRFFVPKKHQDSPNEEYGTYTASPTDEYE